LYIIFDLSTLRAKKDIRLKVAFTSLIASIGLAILKLVVGLLTNSLGILSEAMHSGLDVVAASMTIYAIRLVLKPPDLRYTFGYAKVESISSLTEIILLFAVASWIFYEGIDRLFFKSTEPQITWFSFIIMFVSIGIDYGRSSVLYKTARKFGSHALEADALHFKTDMLSSSIVIVGLLLVLFYHIPNADAYVALIIGAMIIYTSLGLGRRTLDVLLDKAPKGAYQRVLESVSGLDGVNRAHDIHIRTMGSETLVDMHIEVPRTCTNDRAHRIATTVENKIRDVLPNSDVLVHVDAIESETETISDRLRLIAAESGNIRNIHSIYLSNISSSSSNEKSPEELANKNQDDQVKNSKRKRFLHLYLDVQIDNNLDLSTAHTIVDAFEKKVKDDIPDISFITTHIETETSRNMEIGTEKNPTPLYLENIRNIAISVQEVIDCKDIGVVEINGELHITLIIIIKLKSEKTVTTIEDAHRIATHVQNLIVKQTGASRVIVHTEPS
jgi:cation diffusion facilitator family transporter